MLSSSSSLSSPLTRQTFQEEGLHERGSGTALSPLRPTALVTLIVMIRMVMVLLVMVMVIDDGGVIGDSDGD